MMALTRPSPIFPLSPPYHGSVIPVVPELKTLYVSLFLSPSLSFSFKFRFFSRVASALLKVVYLSKPLTVSGSILSVDSIAKGWSL